MGNDDESDHGFGQNSDQCLIKMVADGWVRLYHSAHGSNLNSFVSNFEFWTGIVLVLVACELDFVYFHVLRSIAESFGEHFCKTETWLKEVFFKKKLKKVDVNFS